MKKRFIFITIFVILLSFQIFAQEQENDDKVRIVSINYVSLSSDEIEVSVEIEYKFESGESGIVTIGVSSEKTAPFEMETPLDIKKGSNTVTLKAKIKISDLKKKQMTVLAILTPTPTENSFIPSAFVYGNFQIR